MDNFESLITYLQSYDYRPGADENKDFDDSLACMEEVADEMTARLKDTPVYDDIDLGYSVDTALRLMSAIVLASRKAQRSAGKWLMRISWLILRTNEDLDFEDYESARSIIFSSMCGTKVQKLGYGWSDISNANLFLGALFAQKFLRTEFVADQEQTYYIERNGLLIVKPGQIPMLAAMNMDAYRKHPTLHNQLEVSGIVRFVVNSQELKSKRDYKAVCAAATSLLARQRSVAASKAPTIKEYGDDAFLVRVTERRGYAVIAETIDPRYRQLQGKVNLELYTNAPARASFYDFQKAFQVGAYLMVNKAPENEDGFVFEFGHDFEEWYRSFAGDFVGKSYPAIFLISSGPADIWLTRDGINVSIHRNNLNSLDDDQLRDYEEARESAGSIWLTFYDGLPKEDELYRMWALPGDKYGDVFCKEVFTRDSAYATQLFHYLKDNRQEAEDLHADPDSGTTKVEDTDALYALMTLLVGLMKNNMGDSQQRLQTVSMARFLAQMLELENDADYLAVQSRYLNATVDFAMNGELEQTLDIPVHLQTLGVCAQQADVLRVLRTYKKPLATTVADNRRDADVRSTVAKLVEASNSLIDIIDVVERNNIKLNIARALGVEDEFVSILDNRTHYGMEGQCLEFKKSIVFKPERPGQKSAPEPHPEYQKWNIIKAVNGLLNSRSGGDVLIGVSNQGYPCGLEDDIRALSALNLIQCADMDAYRNYIQCVLDTAFCTDETGQVYDTGISYSCVKVDIENNAERNMVIRIKVQPYPGALTYLVAKGRPENFKSIYMRGEGRTLELKSIKLEQEKDYKKRMLSKAK